MVLIIVGYIVAAIVSTYPLILNLGSFLPGQPNDAFVYMWNIWNFWNQISLDGNPFQTVNVMYPIGANLFFHTYAPLISVIGFPFVNNLPLFLGVLIITSVFLCGLSSYLLLYKITGNKIASFVGGLCYLMSPVLNSFIESQHYYFLFSSIFYPVGIYNIIKYKESENKKYLFYVAILFWLVISIDYYSTVLFSMLVFIFFILSVKIKFKNIFSYLSIFLVSIIIPFVLLFKFEENFKEFVNHKQQTNTSSSCNANLAGFVIPSENNFTLGKLSNYINVKNDISVNLDTPSYFVGWGILVLSLVVVLKKRKTKYVGNVAIIFFVFLLLSLGTNIKFGNYLILDGIFTPFYYFLKIPIIRLIDCPIRFPIILSLCISILIAVLISGHKRIKTAAVVILILLVVEYGIKNVNYSSTEVPKVYKLIKLENNNKTVLEMPSGITESKSAFGYDWSIQALHSKQMYWQTIHNKPRVGIYMSRLTSDKYNYFRNEDVISQIFTYTSARGLKPEKQIEQERILAFIQKFNLGYIVLSPNNRQVEFSDFIDENFKEFITSKEEIEGFIYYKVSDNHF